MYKATQDADHLQRRAGSFSTVASPRGVNLLGWEEPENLSPEERRKCLGRRVGQIQLFLEAHGKTLEGKAKWKLISEMHKLIAKMRKIEVKKHPKDLPHHFVEVARSRLTKAEFDIWMNEARKCANAAQDFGATP